MIDKYRVGLNYETENVDSWVEKIEERFDNKELCLEFGANTKRLTHVKFDRKSSYLEILKRIDEV